MKYDPNLKMPPQDAVQCAVTLKRYLADNNIRTVYGMGDAFHAWKQVEELQRQLAEVTKERDQLRAALELADALRNRENRFGKDNPASAAPYGYFRGEK